MRRGNLESGFVHLELGCHQKLILNCSYIPPVQSTDTNIKFDEGLNEVLSTHDFQACLVLGDFNLADYDFELGPVSPANRCASRNLRTLRRLDNAIRYGIPLMKRGFRDPLHGKC
ncbi:hypothetical protein J6590_022964 [Homalodisca vitripennis]|nr:hypothetical protein J6590_022964 [Homalodisca vitripennis]